VEPVPRITLLIVASTAVIAGPSPRLGLGRG
jgi:hypothetical protein